MTDARYARLPSAEFRRTLAAARRNAGMSFRALAAAASISRGHAHGMESGRACPSEPVAEALIAALHLTGAAAQVIRAEAVPNRGRGRHDAR